MLKLRKTEIMEITAKERFQKKLNKLQNSNDYFRIIRKPVYAIGMMWFRFEEGIVRNKKRFSIAIVTLMTATIYSSFSFPIFASEDEIVECKTNEMQQQTVNYQIINSEAYADRITIQDNSDDFLNTINKIQEVADISTEKAEEDKKNHEEQDYSDYQFSPEDWRYILVNKQHSIPEGYEENIKFGQIVTGRGVMLFDERVVDDLTAMIEAAGEDGVVLEIQSPYRDFTYQRWLFNRKISIYMSQGLSYIEAYQLSSQAVTIPNASEHQIGLSLDILTDNYFNLNEGFAYTAAGRWLAANSYRYGFILRYPKGKEDITCIEYEPWHFRYVGVEAATVIMKNGITLEEFWEEYL